MEFRFILLQLFAHGQEITLQQNYMGVAYANLPLPCGVLLTYLPTYLICLSIMIEMLT